LDEPSLLKGFAVLALAPAVFSVAALNLLKAEHLMSTMFLVILFGDAHEKAKAAADNKVLERQSIAD
jgi:hypothetical protein